MDQINQELMEALAGARDLLSDLMGKQTALDAEACSFGTVVRTMRPPRKTREYVMYDGERIEVDHKAAHMAGFVVGDRLAVKPNKYGSGIPAIVQKAQTLRVVGFYNGYVIIQIDGDVVWDQTPKILMERCDVLDREGRPFGSCIVALGGKLIEMALPDDLHVQPGTIVRVGMTSGKLKRAPRGSNIGFGTPATIVQLVGTDTVEIQIEGQTRICFRGNLSPKLLRQGDRVLVDPSGLVLTRHLGAQDVPVSTAKPETITWDQIGGLDLAKQVLVEAVELPHQHPELYELYGKKPAKGVLLYGPPGCGKTMLGKAVAGSLQKTHGGAGAGTAFLYVKGPELLDPYVGVTEQKIRQVFQRARQHQELHGYPAVIFLDEADALLGRRGGGNSLHRGLSSTVVPMFLTEMDGLDTSSALVILATNRQDILDPAIVREGRVDHKIHVTRPDALSARRIFEINLDGVPLAGCSVQDLVGVGVRELFSKSRTFYQIQLKDRVIPFMMSDLVNGGMVAAVVDQAVTFAMRRDIEEGTLSGVGIEDIRKAVNQVDGANRDVSHDEALELFTEDFRDRVVGVQKVGRNRAENA